MRRLPPLCLLIACSPQPGPMDSGTPSHAPSVTSVSPMRGPSAGGTAVTVNGSFFVDGASVVFGATAAASVTFVSSSQLTAMTAAAPSPGSASVTVISPDGKQATLPDAFVFEGTGQLDEAVITNPPTATNKTGASPLTVTVTAQVKIATVTELAGQGMGVRAQVGFAPDGEMPGSWIDAPFSKDADLFDEYAGTVVLPAPTGMQVATYVLGARFSIDDGATWTLADRDGSSNGYQAAQLPKITVSRPTVDWCKLGGETITLPDVLNLHVGDLGPTIYGQVYKLGVTDMNGAGAGISGELGVGPASADPSLWAWTAATFNHDTGSGANDEHQAVLPTTAPGTSRFAFRFNLNGGPWTYCDSDGLAVGGFTLDQCGTLVLGASGLASCQLVSVDSFQLGSGDPLRVTAAARVPGASADAGVTPGLRGQVGIGTKADNASTGAAWGWGEAAYVSDDDAGRDVFAATAHPAYSGSRAVSFRFSIDNGGSWAYCDLNGSDVGGYEINQQYDVTVGSASAIDYCNLQFPPTATAAVDAGVDVYGQVYLASGSTHPYPGMQAQAGWGRKLEDPGVAWTWVDASYNAQNGNNDEYAARLKPPVGTWSYTFRYTLDGGSWCFGDLDGNGKTMGFNGESGANENLGVLTVTP